MVEEHETLLRGASFAGGTETPVLLQRTDEDPIGVLLEKLGSAEGRAELAGSLAGLKLFQPVHRTWHLALLETACQAPGLPRLDPRRIESAGLVIRRVGAAGALEGWRRAGRKLRGWLPFASGEESLDPDPKKRRPAVSSGHPEIDRRLLLASGEALEESVSPLFVAPPEVCKAAGKTLLYGLVPVASAERSEAPAKLEDLDEKAFDAAVDDTLSLLLKGEKERTKDGGYSWLGRVLRPGSTAGKDDLGKDLKILTACLEQLHIQLDAFEPESEVLARLNRVRLPYGSSFRNAGDVLTEAAQVLLFGTRDSVTLPDAWPEFPQDLQDQIRQAVRSAMKARLGTLTAGEGRFDAPGRSYVLQAFVRVRGHQPGCPSKLVWTRSPSPPFTIVPWYEAGALPPTQVTLPDFTDRGALRKLKPNVAFVLPKGLKDMIEGTSLDGLMKGNSGGAGLALDWICGFNIPLITLCAFFVLNIFLQLLNIVFFWLPFIKICIPFPRKK